MASSFPQPSFTLGATGEDRTRLQTPPQGSSMALVPTTNIDSTSPPGLFGARSPLKSLPDNGSGYGMRQRRGLSTTNNDVYDKKSLALSNETKSRPPPRASLTMSMGSKSSTVATTSTVANDSTSLSATANVIGRSDDHWILVFGFQNERQYEEVTEKFRKVDNVLEAKGGPPGNWVALRYDSAIALEKAICNSPCVLSGGCICGAARLPNSQKFFQSQQEQYSSFNETTMDTSGGQTKTGFLNKTVGREMSNEQNKKVQSDDDCIYMPSKEETDFDTRKNVTERFMGWLYGW